MRAVLLRQILPTKPGYLPLLRSSLHTTSSQSIAAKMRLHLPLQIVVNPKMTVSVVRYHPQGSDLLLKLAHLGDGLSMDEFSKSPNIVDGLGTLPAGTIVEDETDKVLGLIIIKPSPICRSTDPFHHGGYLALDPESAKGKGLGKALINLTELFGQAVGYKGFIGRTSITSSGLVPIKTKGSMYTGIIPNSLNQSHLGWMDDVLMFLPYEDFPRQMRAALLRRILPTTPGYLPLFSSFLHTPSSQSIAAKMRRHLPLQIVVNDKMTVSIISYHDSHKAPLTDLLLKLVHAGDGLSMDEFSKPPNIVDGLGTLPAGTIVEDGTDKILGLIIVRPSPMCRSTDPLHHAGYLALDPESAKGKGLGKTLFNLIQSFGQELGYKGLIGRTAITSSSLVPMKMNGTMQTGIIPNSQNQSRLGWMDDVLLFHPYEDFPKQIDEPPELPPFLLDQPTLSSVRTGDVISSSKYSLPRLLVQAVDMSDDFEVGIPTDSEIVDMEAMFRDAAENGAGFALDEFTSNGVLNCRCLWERNNIIVKSDAGKVIAAVVFGQTTLCRSPNSNQYGGYLVVHRDFRKQGIGSCLLEYCVKMGEDLGIKAILGDVFGNTKDMLSLLLRAGFKVQGHIPYCGYLQNSGYTDSVVVYKQISNSLHPSAKL